MNKREELILKSLRGGYSAEDRYAACDEAWRDLQDFAEAHGYGSRFCALDSAMEWLMSSQDADVRLRTLRLYGVYCATSANVEASNFIGRALADIGI